MKTTTLRIILFVLSFGIITCNGQNRDRLRIPVAAGEYYASGATELKNQLDKLFESVTSKTTEKNINAIIVPNDKYENSGLITASAYSKLNPEQKFVRVFIIGTSHREEFNGISVYKNGDYRTPLGIVKVDDEVVNRLIIQNRQIKYNKKAHNDEYSVEVQLPFLQYWLKKPYKIVPILIGAQSVETCKKLADILEPYFTPDNLFVISSNISSGTDTNNEFIEAITGNSPDKLTKTISQDNQQTDATQIVSSRNLNAIYTMLNITSNKNNVRVERVGNMNSASNNSERADYYSFIIKNEVETAAPNINLGPNDIQFLLRMIRETIMQKLEDNTVPEIEESELSENLKIKYGAFVTLTNDDEIRGNIGKFTTTEPLYKIVQEMAVAAAFRDIRYAPVTKKEIQDIDIEISVVTPLKQIFSSDEFQLGKHGIYMTADGRSGTFMPQTARTTGWSKDEFLGYCARDKAGIGWEGWKTADLFTFEAFVYTRRDAFRRE